MDLETGVVVDFFCSLRARIGLVALMFCGMGSAHAASQDARAILTPPALVEAMRCSAPRYVLLKGFFEQLHLPKRGLAGHYTAQQARAMMTAADNIVTQYCRVMDVQMAARTAVDPGSLTGSPFWTAVQSDDNALQWLRLNSQFLAEIESLHMLVMFGSKLYPGGADPMPPPTAELHQVAEDAAVVSLDDEQRDGRLLLHSVATAPGFREILPARFDIDSLAHIEAMTRTTGTAVLQRHHVSLASVQPAMQDGRAATPEEKRALQKAEQAARKALAALAKKYALPASERIN